MHRTVDGREPGREVLRVEAHLDAGPFGARRQRPPPDGLALHHRQHLDRTHRVVALERALEDEHAALHGAREGDTLHPGLPTLEGVDIVARDPFDLPVRPGVPPLESLELRSLPGQSGHEQVLLTEASLPQHLHHAPLPRLHPAAANVDELRRLEQHPGVRARGRRLRRPLADHWSRPVRQLVDTPPRCPARQERGEEGPESRDHRWFSRMKVRPQASWTQPMKSLSSP